MNIGQVAATGIPASDLFSPPGDISEEVEEVLSAEFATLDPLTRHRGKFLHKFMRIWFSNLHSEFRSRAIGLFGPIGTESGSVLQDELSPGALAGRSPLPLGFSAFIEQY